jgi:REP element-mobilizing transposase RayT
MHSFISCHLHVVFSTKERRRLITPDLQQRLWPYLGGIARENKMKALCVGGAEDHVHIFVEPAVHARHLQSGAIAQGEFVEMDSRNISEPA